MCSCVKPIAPMDWCAMAEMRWAKSEHWLFAAAIEKRPPASSPPSSASRAAASAEAMVAATQLASSASMCWIAWKVEIGRPRSVIGKNTVENLQSGFLYGTVGQVDGLVRRIQAELKVGPGELKVVATGGLAPVVLAESETITHHEPILTLIGLRLVFERNFS